MSTTPQHAAHSTFEDIYHLEDQINQLTRQIARLRARHDEQPVTDYFFSGWRGDVRLSELFGAMEYLFVVHNMGSTCRYCAMWADGVNAILPQLKQVASIVISNHDPCPVQKRQAEERGWSIPMVNAGETDFTERMGFRRVEGGKAEMLPGCTGFRRLGDNSIQRLSAAYFGPHDRFCPTYAFLDLLPASVADRFEPI